MAGKQFIFNTNVGITENYATNFFDVSGIQITARTDLSITSVEKCAEVLNQMANIYNEIQVYCDNNINETDIYTFASGMQEVIINLSPKSIKEMFFVVSDVANPSKSYLNVSFIFI